MTGIDQHVLTYLVEHHQYTGRLPSIKQACFDLDMLHGQLYRHLKRLARNGKLIEMPRPVPYRLPDAA